MDDRNRRKYAEKHPPDKEKKIKYVEKTQGSKVIERESEKPRAPKFYPKNSSQDDHQCIICSQNVGNRDSIWTCNCCYQYLHLRCMKQWIINVNKDTEAKRRFIYNWSCPQCKFQYNEAMPEYYCFCGKYKNPEYQRDYPAHTCGKLCHRKRGPYCPHLCPSTCHSGKCPPCQHEGIEISCSCGKSQRTIKCSQERQVFQCGKKCEKILNCHKHKCERNCHNGVCHPCNKKHLVKCFCGKNQDVVDCMDISFSCTDTCSKTLNCGVHKCQTKCHDGQCSPCLNTPDLQKTCPCGKYQLELLTDAVRQSCSDPITCCGGPCKKNIQCGHQCSTSCHEGKCPNCKINITQYCRCGLSSRKIDCYSASRDVFMCDNICKRKKTCGNHTCNTVCCPHRTSVIPQQHPCELTCPKQLNCQKHTCGEPCHIGNCKKCPVIYSQPQACPCGKTFLKPPILCGSYVPQCENTCNKTMACGHICYLNCHYGNCKCNEKVLVKCRCGREEIQTTCGRQTLCLNKCDLLLDCGHKCLIQCHLGTCQQAHKLYPCRKNCGKQRQTCEHLCNEQCHQGFKCQQFPCEVEIVIKCECGNRQTTIICGNSDKKNKKSIVCNKKCQNMKRFKILYSDKQIYYPTPMFQFGFKNFPYMQRLEERLQKFITQSEASCLEIQFKFINDNNARYQLLNLLENHYHLNAHFYKFRQHASFTVMQTEDTMVPKPTLTQYIKQVAKGQIKRNNLPFELTIKFQLLVKEKLQLILSNLKELKHRYYVQRKDKLIYINFWDKKDGYVGLSMLQKNTPGVEFTTEEFMVTEDQIEAIPSEEIIQTLAAQLNVQEGQAEKLAKNKEEKQQAKEGKILGQKAEKKQNVEKGELLKKNQYQQQVKQGKQQLKDKKQIKEEEKVIKQSKQVKIVKEGEEKKSKIIVIRNKVPLFQVSSYPPSKESVQDIYLIDEDQLYQQKVDWQLTLNQILSKKIGPEASEWKIRAMIMINTFHQIPEEVLAIQFEKIIQMYEKQKQKASRILQIQRLQSKKIQQQMSKNGIYLSDHQPEIYAFLILFNFWSSKKIELKISKIMHQTPEVQLAYEFIQAVEEKDVNKWYQLINGANYIMSCAAIPLLAQLRQNVTESLKKNEKIGVKNLYNYLLFESEQSLIKYFKSKGITVSKQIWSSKKQEVYVLSQKGQSQQGQLGNKLVMDYLNKKRHKSNFLQQPSELVNNQLVTRSFIAFGDFKEAIAHHYMISLVKTLKNE